LSDYIDKLIKEAVTEQIGSFPVPDLDEEWELLQRRVNGEQKRGFGIKKIAVAVIILLCLAGGLSASYTSEVREIKGAAVHIENSIFGYRSIAHHIWVKDF
jgi:hypothetical protein